MLDIKKIALIGPESSGKSTLCAALAAHYQTEWVPEISREYIGSLQRKYTLEDVEECTRRQLDEEEKLLPKANRFLFCDSDMIIAKVWCEDLFKIIPSWIEESANTHRYDLHLLLHPDLPFVPDPVRENPHRRQFFFDWYKRELFSRNFPFEEIVGKEGVRFQNCLRAIAKHFPDYKNT